MCPLSAPMQTQHLADVLDLKAGEDHYSGIKSCVSSNVGYHMCIPVIYPFPKDKSDCCVAKVFQSVKGCNDSSLLGDCAGSCEGCSEQL